MWLARVCTLWQVHNQLQYMHESIYFESTGSVSFLLDNVKRLMLPHERIITTNVT